MPTIIPPIPRGDRNSAAFEALRNLFRFSGFDEGVVCERLGIAKLSGVQPEAVRRNDTGPLRNASDALIRLFIEGWPVLTSDLQRLLTAEGLSLLADFQLVMAIGEDSQAATVSLYPIENLLVASDRYNNADGSLYDGWDDLVYPCLFSTTRKFSETIPRTACDEVLDLCAGTGIGALLVASTARRVVAADVTPRCEEFMRFNAKLNGFENIEPVTGDLYAPVQGQRFDRIITHPPYQPVLEHIATFNSGGVDGEQITRRIIEGAPAHLKPGGQLFSLCQLTDREDPVELRVRQWITETESRDCDTAFVVYKHHDLTRYTAIETLQERKNHAAWQSWMKALGDAGVTDMVYGMVMLQRRAVSNPDREVFSVRREGPESGRDDLPKLLELEANFQSREFAAVVLASRLLARQGATMQVTHSLTGGKWRQDKLAIQRKTPFEVKVEIDPVTANLLSMMDGTKTGSQLRDTLPFQVPDAQMAGLVRMLASNGFVEILPAPAPST
jgi:SAM-dependent methyltransferase